MPKATLLVVEDEPNLLLGIRDILELDDYAVMTAHNGVEALKVLQAAGDNIPDLIVSDIMMPQLDGLELLKEVRKNDDWVMIPFIFLTAKGGKADVQHGKRLGVDDYIIKPFDAEDLLVAVESRLRRHQEFSNVQASVISSIKRNILTILNHEFRTPLTLVVAYADMLKENNVDGMNEQELLMFLREINTGADRLRRLIENFIMLVELETGDAQRTYEWRQEVIDDFEPVISEAMKRLAGESAVSLNCKVDRVNGALPPVRGDRIYLMTIITELLLNAVKFSEADAPITVELDTHEGWLAVRVIDQGRGINPDQLEHIWDSFYQIDRDYFEDQGAGSGLAIVRGLTEIHRGRLDVTSTVGEGSCFTLLLPPAS
ncbi:MAG: hybrid sensor histidine kinase/response regulator [Chloroflexota bacterium]